MMIGEVSAARARPVTAPVTAISGAPNARLRRVIGIAFSPELSGFFWRSSGMRILRAPAHQRQRWQAMEWFPESGRKARPGLCPGPAKGRGPLETHDGP